MGLKVGIVGATGLVGEKILRILEERKFPIDKLELFASGQGKTEEYFNGKKIIVKPISNIEIPEMDIAFFSAGTEIPLKYAKEFVKKGATVIDNSPAFREDEDKPLIVPEINGDSLKPSHRIIANPNCSTIIMLLPVYPIYRKWGIKRIITSTYQSVSGAGRKALEDLEQKKNPPEYFPISIERNIIPHIGRNLDSGFSSEERKMLIETRKILSDDEIKVSSTCARVPVRVGHAISVTAEIKQSFDVGSIKKELSNFKGVVVYDEPQRDRYPHPLLADDRDEVFAGRIRKDPIFNNGLSMWVCGDNLRKGAATNAVQIAELLL
jgi:aspartate-semialdehyde dehydrogenase